MENTMHKVPLIIPLYNGTIDDFNNYLTKIGEYYFIKGKLNKVKAIQMVQVEIVAAYKDEMKKRGK